MKIIVAGTGFVGLTHAAVCSEYGHEVYAYDIDSSKITAYQTADKEIIERYVNEPGLADIVADNIDRYLFFVDEIEPIIEGTDAIFLCLPTPPNPNGSSDLSYYMSALDNIAPLLAQRADQRRVVFINKSTVPVGTARQLEAVLNKHGVPNFGIASNRNSCLKATLLKNHAVLTGWLLGRHRRRFHHHPAHLFTVCQSRAHSLH